MICGESGCVDEEVMRGWKSHLPDITAGYASCHIYNKDENGIFFRAFTNTTTPLMRPLDDGPIGAVSSLRGAVPPLTAACAPHFGLLKILFLEHLVTTKQQAMMEKGIITLKHNSPLSFFLFFAKLLATNCCT